MDTRELEIWKNACSGDINAFEWVFRTYQPRLFSFSYELLSDADRAKDLVQECFIVLWKHLHTIKQPEASVQYMYTILRNLCRREVRNRSVLARFQNLAETTLKEAEIDWFLNDPDVLDDLYYAELHDRWQKALDALPARCRQIVRMRKEKEMSNKEIAQELNLSVRTVEDEVYKGIRTIRLQMKDCLAALLILMHIIH